VHDQLEERTLIKSLFISRNALREALKALAREGVVVRRPRQGTMVVRPGFTVSLDSLMSGVELDRVHLDQFDVVRTPANDMIRGLFGSHVESVLVFEQLLSVDDDPICVHTIYIDSALDPEIVQERLKAIDHSPKLTADAFEEFFHARLGNVVNYIKSIGCGPEAAKIFGVIEGTPVLLRETVHIDEYGVPRMLAYSHYRGDAVSLEWNASLDAK
jgi:GntR family transcriptional regulator